MKHWHHLQQPAQLSEITAASHERPQLIFKHSTRCGISAHIQHQLFAATEDLAAVTDLHYLDLIDYRPASNEVAAQLHVPHQSPQVILLKDGKVVHHSSHFSIEPGQIVAAVS